MADFCMQCWPTVFGDPKEIDQPEGFNDLSGLFEDEEDDFYVHVICEGCGATNVNSKGRCLGPCLQHHETARAN